MPRRARLGSLGAMLVGVSVLAGCEEEPRRLPESTPTEPRMITPDLAVPGGLSNQDLSSRLRERIGEQDSVSLALGRSPELGVLRQERSASRARLYQSGLYTYNPAILLGVDDLAVEGYHPHEGLGPYPGKEQFGVVQTVEFPTKRGRRIELGEALVRASDADFEAKEREVRMRARLAFDDILVAQERLGLARGNEEIAIRQHKVADARVAGGAALPIESARAEVEELRASNDVKTAERDVAMSKARLAGILGDPSIPVGDVTGELQKTGPDLKLDTLTPLVDKHPALRAKFFAIEAAEANLSLQKALPWPDPTFIFTYNRVRGDTDVITADVLIPIPVINHNSGGIQEARLSIEKAEADAGAQRTNLYAALQSAYSSYDAARRTAELLRTKTIPAAERSLALAEDGWKSGKFRYLDVLDARHSLAQIRAEYVTSLHDLNHAMVELEELTGTSVVELAK